MANEQLGQGEIRIRMVDDTAAGASQVKASAAKAVAATNTAATASGSAKAVVDEEKKLAEALREAAAAAARYDAKLTPLPAKHQTLAQAIKAAAAPGVQLKGAIMSVATTASFAIGIIASLIGVLFSLANRHKEAAEQAREHARAIQGLIYGADSVQAQVAETEKKYDDKIRELRARQASESVNQRKSTENTIKALEEAKQREITAIYEKEAKERAKKITDAFKQEQDNVEDALATPAEKAEIAYRHALDVAARFESIGGDATDLRARALERFRAEITKIEAEESERIEEARQQELEGRVDRMRRLHDERMRQIKEENDAMRKGVEDYIDAVERAQNAREKQTAGFNASDITFDLSGLEDLVDKIDRKMTPGVSGTVY